MNLEFTDAYGGQIEATIFNDDIDTFDNKLEQGKVYIISNSSVKVANAKFSNVNNEYCLTFHPKTNVVPAEEDSMIKKVSYNFKGLSQIAAIHGSTNADVLVVITHIGNSMSISTKNGERDKLDITVMDLSDPKNPNNTKPKMEELGTRMNATVWGKQATEFPCKVGDVVAIKSLRSSFFRDAPQLNIGDES